MEIVREWCALEPVIAQALDLVRPIAERKGVALRVQTSCIGYQARVDPRQFPEVVSNLLGNAVKFSRPGGQVTIDTRSAGDALEVLVSDEGPGIAPPDLKHVFERFWRAKGRNEEGAGLGLHIVARIVRAHGGSVSASANPTGGTVFRVTLPHSARPGSKAA